ncbi:unnamed protein product, partial [Brassica rapa]
YTNIEHSKRVRSTTTPVAAPHYCVEPPEQADSPWSHTPSRAGDDTNSKPLTRDTDKAVTGHRRRSSKGETRLAKEEASGAGTRAHALSGRRSVIKTTFKSREKSSRGLADALGYLLHSLNKPFF